MWQFTKVSSYSNREIPLDIDTILDLVSGYEPENEYQALMEAPPGAEVATPKTYVNEAKEIVRDCIELLLPQDEYIIHAIHYERITYEELGARLGCSGPHAWRLTQIAHQHLGEVLLVDGRIKKMLGFHG